jgi:site-specific DNA recombinase
MKTAALYIRVSTDRQEELSPEAQKRLLMDYAKKNQMIVSTKYIFFENGISGKKADKRPEFQKMITLAKSKEHPIDVILVWKFSRFARNQEESIVYKSLLKKINIEVISISEPVLDGPFGSLIERIIEWMDEYYSTNLSSEVTRGMTERALKGGYQARPPLGYKIITPKTPPVIIPSEAEIIKTIFQKYVYEGLTFFQIAKYLNAFGFKTDRGKNFERRSIEYILQNPTYKGYIRWNRTHNATNTVKDESEWIIKKGEHEPIITEELFNLAFERYQRECTNRTKKRPVTEYKHWLSGLVKCSNCGRSLTASTVRKSKYMYFNCNGYTKGKCLVSNSISEKVLVPYIFDAIQKVITTGDVDYKVSRHEQNTNAAILFHQLNKLTNKEIRMKEAYINGVDSLEEYKLNKALLQKERYHVQVQITEIEQANQSVKKEAMINSINNIYSVITDNEKDNITKNKAMKSMIEKIVVNKELQQIDVFFYIN